MSEDKASLYNGTFIIGFAFNFFMGFLFTNNALYPLYVEYEGGGAAEIGLFMAAFAVSAGLCRPLTGLLVDWLGVRPILMLGALSLSLPCLGYLFMLDHGLVFFSWLLRIVQGFGWGCHMTAFFTMAGQVAPAGRRNEAIAMYGMSGLASNMVGPVTGELLIDHFGMPAFFVMFLVMGAIAFVLIMQIPLPKRMETSAGLTLRGFYTVVFMPVFWLAFVLAMLHAVSYSSISAFLAPIAKMRDIAMFSLFFTAFSISGVAIRLLGSHWGDRHGVVRILLPGYFLYVTGLLILQITSSVMGILLAGVICGIAHGLSFPAVTNLGYSLAPSAYRGTGVALVTGMMDAGNALSSFLLGQIGEVFGFYYLFGLASLAPLMGALLLMWNQKKLLHKMRAP
ncbi:MFS transporter [bacterium]|nr:MFS transporter [bacterium]